MTSPQQEPATPEAQDAPAAPPASSAEAEAVRTAYAFEGGRIHLGAMLDGDQPDPSVPVNLAVSMLNRHGLIAGATGTGKTRTLQVIAEQAAHAGAAVFVAAMKGDRSGLAVPAAAAATLPARPAARPRHRHPARGRLHRHRDEHRPLRERGPRGLRHRQRLPSARRHR